MQVFQKIKENDFEKRDFYLQANSMVEVDGEKLFMLGPSDAPIFRNVYQLDAVTVRSTSEIFKKIVKLEVNELGEIKKQTALYGNSED